MPFFPHELPADAPVRFLDQGEADCEWNGCDAHNPTRHYRGHLDGSRRRAHVSLHLTWRATLDGARVEVGTFSLDVARMLDEGLAREERGGARLAVRIVHERVSDRLVIRLNESAPALVLGRLQ